MRIVIDFQGAQTASRFRGIGRYTLALVQGMVRNAGDHEIWLALNGALEEPIAGIRAAFDGLIPQERICVFQIPQPAADMEPRNTVRHQCAELLREHFLERLQPDVVLITSLFEGYTDNAVATVGAFADGRLTAAILYDLIPYLHPETYLASARQQKSYARKIASLRQAGMLLSISDYARQEAIDALGLDPERVVSISTAVDTSFAPGAPTPASLAAFRDQFGITRKALMYAPGGFDARKNIDGLISAYALLPAALRADHQLVIASKMTELDRQSLTAHAAQAGLNADELVLTGYVSDAMLIDMYRAATLFIFASRHEGFGLPALEAMSCGALVIGADNSSIPEVIGSPEALFDTRSPRAIADKIEQVLSDPALRERLRANGRSQAAKFSWDTTARRALHALEGQFARHQAARLDPAMLAQRRGALLSALAAVPGLAQEESTQQQVAMCLAAMPDPQEARQLLIEVTSLQDDPSAPVQALLKNTHPLWRVQAVSLVCEQGQWLYRYDNGQGTRGAPVEVRGGDVFHPSYEAPDASAAAEQAGLYTHWRAVGVVMLDAGDDPARLIN
jgi:glycosyltransferase involved in cell wall biosynthesis